MESLEKVMKEAVEYAKAYQDKYKIKEDDDLLVAIYLGHLTHLLNS